MDNYGSLPRTSQTSRIGCLRQPATLLHRENTQPIGDQGFTLTSSAQLTVCLTSICFEHSRRE